jgi:hypothetical protein
MNSVVKYVGWLGFAAGATASAAGASFTAVIVSMTTPSPAVSEIMWIALFWTIVGCFAWLVIRSKLKTTLDELQRLKEFNENLVARLGVLAANISQEANEARGRKLSGTDG